jgi:hypothetical protein
MEVEIKGLRGTNGEFGALGVVTVPGGADETLAFIADVARQPEWSPGVTKATVEPLPDGTKAVHQVRARTGAGARGWRRGVAALPPRGWPAAALPRHPASC